MQQAPFSLPSSDSPKQTPGFQADKLCSSPTDSRFPSRQAAGCGMPLSHLSHHSSLAQTLDFRADKQKDTTGPSLSSPISHISLTDSQKISHHSFHPRRLPHVHRRILQRGPDSHLLFESVSYNDYRFSAVSSSPTALYPPPPPPPIGLWFQRWSPAVSYRPVRDDDRGTGRTSHLRFSALSPSASPAFGTTSASAASAPPGAPPRPSPIPSLLLPYDLSSTARSFFDPSDRRVRTLDLPESRNKWLYGTPYGWLVMIGTSETYAAGKLRAYTVSLLNPITRAHLSLPRLDGNITGSIRTFTFVSPKPVLSADPSSSLNALPAILTPRCRLGICRVRGGEAWTWIDLVCRSARPHSLRRTISDIAYFDGAFYVVDITKGITSIKTSTLKKRYSVPPRKEFYLPFNLVESSGKLLLIERVSGIPQEIFELDRSSRKFKWVTLGESIGHRALFVSKKHSSISVPSPDVAGCQWRDVIFSAADHVVDRKDALVCISDIVAGMGVTPWPYYWHRSNRTRAIEKNAIGLTWIIPSLY